MTEPQRLSKRVTELFQCSRREAELLIEGGWVLVDGEVQEAPQFKVLDQAVTLLPDAVAEPVPPATLCCTSLPGRRWTVRRCCSWCGRIPAGPGMTAGCGC